MSDLHDADVVAWSDRQSALLRRVAAGESVNEPVDWTNIIDEVETVGRSERSALRSLIAVVIEHLMKLEASPATAPRNGWKISVLTARRGINRVLRDSPSLRHDIAGMIADETPGARQDVARTLAIHGEQPRVEIDRLTYSRDEVLGDWWPASDP